MHYSYLESTDTQILLYFHLPNLLYIFIALFCHVIFIYFLISFGGFSQLHLISTISRLLKDHLLVSTTWKSTREIIGVEIYIRYPVCSMFLSKDKIVVSLCLPVGRSINMRPKEKKVKKKLKSDTNIVFKYRALE